MITSSADNESTGVSVVGKGDFVVGERVSVRDDEGVAGVSSVCVEGVSVVDNDVDKEGEIVFSESVSSVVADGIVVIVFC